MTPPDQSESATRLVGERCGYTSAAFVAVAALKRENEQLRGLLTLWLNFAPANVRDAALGGGETLGKLTKRAFDEKRA
jgi:hypothetical protein